MALLSASKRHCSVVGFTLSCEDQTRVTLNSLGERAGNTSLEEVVMALRTRPHLFPVHCDIDT
eukprot:scaffold7674_cov37-Tisochrysis_lutea.AAC.3